MLSVVETSLAYERSGAALAALAVTAHVGKVILATAFTSFYAKE